MSSENKDVTDNNGTKKEDKDTTSYTDSVFSLLSKGKDGLMSGLSQGKEALTEYMSLENELVAAQQVLTVMMASGDNSVPSYIVKNAKGFAFMTEVKGGLIVSLSVGSGIILGKTEDGWTGPSCFTFGGGSLGFQAGATKTSIVLILNTLEAVKAFATRAQLTIGVDLQVAAGPVGRELSGQVVGSSTSIAPVYSYSHSKGLFAGVSLDGGLIVTRTDENERFYGKKVTPEDILLKEEEVPREKNLEYNLLINELTKSMESNEKEDDGKDEESQNSYTEQLSSWVTNLNKTFLDATTMESELKRTLSALTNFRNSKLISPYILQNAQGFAFMMEIKAGLFFSGKGGVGLVIKKLGGSKWSGPSCFWFGGLAAGLAVGGSKTELVLVLNSEKAVDAFASGKKQLKVGLDLEVTAGPIGKQVGTKLDIESAAPCYSYSNTKGLYAGTSIDGMMIFTRWEENERFYYDSNKSEKITPRGILNAEILPPDNDDLENIQKILRSLC